MHQLIDQRVDQRVQRKDFSMLHLDVHWCTSRCIPENLSFEFFDLPFDHVHWCTLDVRRIGIHGLCIPVDSFDLRCESVTYTYVHTLHQDS